MNRLDQELQGEMADLQRHRAHCPEPHHAHVADERAHRAHHWNERLKCLGLCTALHIALEFASHYLH